MQAVRACVGVHTTTAPKVVTVHHPLPRAHSAFSWRRGWFRKGPGRSNEALSQCLTTDHDHRPTHPTWLPPLPRPTHTFPRPHPQTDPEHFDLHPHPIDIDYDEFERLLLGIAHHVYVTKKQQGAFEEFLGDVLDSVFKKAGVLVQVARQDGDDDDGRDD